MYRNRQLGWAATAGMAMVLILAIAAPASARKYQMSGTWLMRKGQSFIPLQFAGLSTNVSMGSWTEAPFYPPNQVISDTGVVEQNGASPASIMIRSKTFKKLPSAVIPLVGGAPPLIQITSMFEIGAPRQAATLASGGGPGSFTWCPANPACAFPGAIPGPSPAGAGNNGRVVYNAGGNMFGGVMRMGLRYGGWVSVQPIPGIAAHAKFGGDGITWRNLANGGGANDVPGTEMVKLGRGALTLPASIPAQPGIIMTPGPVIGVMPRCCTAGMSMTGQYSDNFGFPHTTGTVLVQMDSAAADVIDFFSIMGSDTRTPLGAGNVSTVAGGITIRVNNIGNDSAPVAKRVPYASFDKVWLTLGPTVPSMSPAGFAAAGALMLLAVGYALRRRLS